MTAEEIMETVNHYDYDEAAPLLEKILSEQLRGKVYLGVIHKHVEALFFEREYYKRMMSAHYNPQSVIEAYIEKWGFDVMVKYLTEREDNERTLRIK